MFKVPEGGKEVYIKEPQTKNRHSPLLYSLLQPAKLRRSNPQVIFKFYLAQTSWSIVELSFLFYLLRKRPQLICTFEQSEFVSLILFIKDVFACDFDWWWTKMIQLNQYWFSFVSYGVTCEFPNLSLACISFGHVTDLVLWLQCKQILNHKGLSWQFSSRRFNYDNYNYKKNYTQCCDYAVYMT